MNPPTWKVSPLLVFAWLLIGATIISFAVAFLTGCVEHLHVHLMGTYHAAPNGEAKTEETLDGFLTTLEDDARRDRNGTGRSGDGDSRRDR